MRLPMSRVRYVAPICNVNDSAPKVRRNLARGNAPGVTGGKSRAATRRSNHGLLRRVAALILFLVVQGRCPWLDYYAPLVLKNALCITARSARAPVLILIFSSFVSIQFAGERLVRLCEDECLKTCLVCNDISIDHYNVALGTEATEKSMSAVLDLDQMFSLVADLNQIAVSSRNCEVSSEGKRTLDLVASTIRGATEAAGKPVAVDGNVDRRRIGNGEFDVHDFSGN